MVTLDRIRLIGLLRRRPRRRGFLHGPDSPATRQSRRVAGMAESDADERKHDQGEDADLDEAPLAAWAWGPRETVATTGAASA
jgi:hypothetical protein